MKDTLDDALLTPPAPPSSDAALLEGDAVSSKQNRTFGLKAVDKAIYFTSNALVIAGSVALTYLTMRGDTQGGGFGRWAHGRGESFKHQITEGWVAKNVLEHANIHVDSKQADAFKMVAFSFLDGSAFTIPVWIAEKFRTPMAKKIDEMTGNVPDDLSVYENAKEKQGLLSLLGGRVATLAIVLPVATVLGKVGTDKAGQWIWNKVENNQGFNSLNDHMFNNRGRDFGEWAGKNVHVEKLVEHTKLDIPMLGSIGAFETFYTSVCTGSLYVISRAIAAVTGRKQEDATINTLPDIRPVTIAPTFDDAMLKAQHVPHSVSVQPEKATVISNTLPDKTLHEVTRIERVGQINQLAPAFA
jgi:hypothetical protein